MKSKTVAGHTESLTERNSCDPGRRPSRFCWLAALGRSSDEGLLALQENDLPAFSPSLAIFVCDAF